MKAHDGMLCVVHTVLLGVCWLVGFFFVCSFGLVWFCGFFLGSFFVCFVSVGGGGGVGWLSFVCLFYFVLFFP